MISTDDYVTVDGYEGIAWYVQGKEQIPVPMEDVEYYYEEDVEYQDGDDWICTMVGDDRKFTFEESELTKLPEDMNVCSCGQLGCGWGG
jgi:hypothetical protein